MAEKKKTENLNSNGFSDWEHLQPSSPPATSIPISDDPFLSIFPPINHEGLPSDELSASAASSSSGGDTSELYSRSPTPVSPIVWVLRALKAKALSGFRSWMQSETSVGSVVALVMVGVWMWWRRRRRSSRDGSVERLNVLVREKDEKIIELLNQVSQLNKLLLARYRIPVIRDS